MSRGEGLAMTLVQNFLPFQFKNQLKIHRKDHIYMLVSGSSKEARNKLCSFVPVALQRGWISILE